MSNEIKKKDSSAEAHKSGYLTPITKFSNEVNDNNLFKQVDNFSELENNLFFAIVAQVYNKGTSNIYFEPQQMRELIGYDKHITLRDFVKKIDAAFAKFLTIQEVRDWDDKDGKHHHGREQLFTGTDIAWQSEDLECTIRVTKPFVDLFNNLSSQWTRFSVIQYARMRSSYSKRLYRLLKQWRTVGRLTITFDDFKDRLGIGKSYKPGNVDQRILKPAKEELSAAFQNFRIQKNYAKGVRGRKLASYTFSFRPESNREKSYKPSKLMDETIALYYIKSNPYLTVKEKFRAIDRYRNLKLGTSEKLYKDAHPNTFFLTKDVKHRSKRNLFVRANLMTIFHMSPESLYSLIKVYEEMKKKKLLEEGDLSDLELMKEQYEHLEIVSNHALANPNNVNNLQTYIDATKIPPQKKERKFHDVRLFDEEQPSELDKSIEDFDAKDYKAR